MTDARREIRRLARALRAQIQSHGSDFACDPDAFKEFNDVLDVFCDVSDGERDLLADPSMAETMAQGALGDALGLRFATIAMDGVTTMADLDNPVTPHRRGTLTTNLGDMDLYNANGITVRDVVLAYDAILTGLNGQDDHVFIELIRVDRVAEIKGKEQLAILSIFAGS